MKLHQRRSGFFRCLAFRNAAFVCLLALSFLETSGCKPDRDQSQTHQMTPLSHSSPFLSIRPDPLSLGTLMPGESAKSSLTIENSHSTQVSIENIETSCPCVRLAPVSFSLGTHETATVAVVFDPTGETMFRGNLSVDVIGKGRGGVDVFRSQVDLESATTRTLLGRNELTRSNNWIARTYNLWSHLGNTCFRQRPPSYSWRSWPVWDGPPSGLPKCFFNT